MEIIVQVLMVLVCIVASLKLSHSPRWFTVLYAIGVFAFIVFMGDWTSGQSKSLISSYIDNKELRENIAILVSLESFVFILFTFMKLSIVNYSSPFKSKLRKMILYILSFYPSLLVFPILLYLQSHIFMLMTGYDFGILSWIIALVMFAFFIIIPMIFRLLLSEKELRLELLFLSSIFIFIFGLITTVDDKMTYSPPVYDFPWLGFLWAISLLLVCMLIGFYIPYFKKNKYKEK